MQCGKPVFLSRATSLPEVAGEEGFYFESYEPKGMAKVLLESLAVFVEPLPIAVAHLAGHDHAVCELPAGDLPLHGGAVGGRLLAGDH